MARILAFSCGLVFLLSVSLAAGCPWRSPADVVAAASNAICPPRGASCDAFTFSVMDQLRRGCGDISWAAIKQPHTVGPSWPQYSGAVVTCAACGNFNVYGIANGQKFCLRNDGARGFTEWIAVGSQTQDDNYFLYHGASRGDCRIPVNRAEVDTATKVIDTIGDDDGQNVGGD